MSRPTQTEYKLAPLRQQRGMDSVIGEHMQPKVTCFENQIPEAAEQELDRLYGSVDSSLRSLRLSGQDQCASTYVRELEGRATTVLIYRVESRMVRVLTSHISLSSEEANDFAEFTFDRYPGVAKILFPIVGVDLQGLRKPRYASLHKSDVVIDPAPDLERYQAGLSKSVRKSLNNKRNQLLRDFPDFEVSFYDDSNFSEADVREILALSRARMEVRGDIWNYSGKAADDLLALLRQGGVVGVARIGGRICGGNVSYRFGDSYTGEVCAYDARYASYRLGFYLAWLSNLEVLRRGAKRILLGFMVYDYKLWLGGRARRLDRVVIYRSHLFQLRDGPANLAHYCASGQQLVLAQARHAARRKDLLGECLRMSRAALRTVKLVPKLIRSVGR